MTMENYLSQMGMAQKQLAERYAEYSGPAQDQPLYYPYEPALPSQGHVTSFKHQFISGGHKNNAAMSALTLLAFLFFLHILQQCLKDHMTAMSTPQVMIMTGGRKGEENIAKLSHNKIDKTGEVETEHDIKVNIKHGDASDATNVDNEKYLMKITTSERGAWKKHETREKFQNVYNIFSRFDNDQTSRSSQYTSAADN